jgi:uncharacterized membrane protein YecN with MAPEG domain
MAIGLYAGVLAIIFVGLSFRVISLRLKGKVSLGDGKNESLMRSIRAHGNFAEHIPLALFLVFLCEFNASDIFTSSPTYIHVMGCALVFGRLLHAYALMTPSSPMILRPIAMLATYSVILGAAGILIYQYY